MAEVCRAVSEVDTCSMLASVWPSVHHSLTLMTSLSTVLSNQVHEFWYQQSYQLQMHQGSSISSYTASLTQLGPLLPMLLEVLVSVKRDCSFPVLHNLTFQESVSLQLQLLIRCYHPSEGVTALLAAAACSPSEGINEVWQTTVSTVQVRRRMCSQLSVSLRCLRHCIYHHHHHHRYYYLHHH